MRYVVLVTLGLMGASTWAGLPKDPTTKKEVEKLRAAALDYADNQTPGTTDGLRKALRNAQNANLLKGLGDPDRLSEAELKRVGRGVQLAAACEVVGVDSNGLVMRGVMWPHVPSEGELMKWAKACGYAGARVNGSPNSVAPPKLSPTTGQ